jgi:DnaJ-class molecular chaperone
MKKLNGEPIREVICSACDGTGLPKVKQPDEPGRRIFPAPCRWCLGKGRLTVAASSKVR